MSVTRAARALLDRARAELSGDSTDLVERALAELDLADASAARLEQTDLRMQEIVDTLFGLASMELDRRVELKNDGSLLDAVVGCINMLAEELFAYVSEKHEAQEELERRVLERTAMLTEANRALADGIAARAKMEIELRQAHKLEAVGRLASGIAHEINTPVQFVSDSLHFIAEATQEMIGLIGSYQAACQALARGEPYAQAVERVLRAEDKADLGYLLEHVPKALARSGDGLNRVATIVRSMKLFAHPDGKEMSSVDLNQALESTLTIARNEYKYVATVETDFGVLPTVTCHVGDVNQAFLNIIVNASHAIADSVKDTGATGRISVRTRQDGDHVVVTISDTGPGIAEALREHIFEPFFTTKEVGRGTGQGLAIARSIIVDRHGGKLSFETALGMGTTFIVVLPISPRHLSMAGAAAPAAIAS